METKTTPPAPKRVKVCSRTTDPLAKQVHAIQTRVTALRARGIDANNTVGRGRLPDVLMGIIWTCLGATGIARACRTSASMYICARTAPANLRRLYMGKTAFPTRDPLLIAAWPSLSRVHAVSLYPHRLATAATYMTQLADLTVARHGTDVVDEGAFRMHLQVMAPKLEAISLHVRDRTTSPAQWMPECDWDKLTSFAHDNVGAANLGWMGKQSWLPNLTSLTMALRFDDDVKQVRQLTVLYESLPRLSTMSLGLSFTTAVVHGHRRAIRAAVYGTIPSTVTDLSLGFSIGASFVASAVWPKLQPLKRLTRFQTRASHVGTPLDMEMFMDAHPTLVVLVVRFKVANSNNYVKAITDKLPHLEVFSFDSTGVQSAEDVGRWLDAHPRVNRKLVWNTCDRVVLKGSKWDEECLSCTSVLELAEPLSVVGQHLMWSARGPSIDVVSSHVLDRIELKTPNRNIRKLIIEAPARIDDEWIASLLNTFPKLGMLLLRPGRDAVVGLSKATMARLAKAGLFALDAPLTLSDGCLQDLVDMIGATPRGVFRFIGTPSLFNPYIAGQWEDRGVSLRHARIRDSLLVEMRIQRTPTPRIADPP